MRERTWWERFVFWLRYRTCSICDGDGGYTIILKSGWTRYKDCAACNGTCVEPRWDW